MYALHPLTVHLPIGLLIGNALLTALYLRRGDPALETSAYHCLWLGLLLTLPAVLTGTYAAVWHLTSSAAGNSALGWINAHALVGIALVVVYWQAWQQRRRHPAVLADVHKRRGYLVRLGLGVALLVLDGWIGGHMVYALGVGVNGP
ncbi:MAG TPA: DUF2231 domain-containing protein [Roseiflexaceae bacterium]|jgi:uncharacterized membrane protein|nr:DUF2231 domain-containing protein [Roseiflexaceae bacterium]